MNVQLNISLLIDVCVGHPMEHQRCSPVSQQQQQQQQLGLTPGEPPAIQDKSKAFNNISSLSFCSNCCKLTAIAFLASASCLEATLIE